MEYREPPESAFRPLDEEEAQMMAEMEAGEWVPLPEPELSYQKSLLKAAAANTLAKKKSLSIRIPQGDLLAFKREAEETLIPYQIIIASVLHRYANRKLEPETEHNRH